MSMVSGFEKVATSNEIAFGKSTSQNLLMYVRTFATCVTAMGIETLHPNALSLRQWSQEQHRIELGLLYKHFDRR